MVFRDKGHDIYKCSQMVKKFKNYKHTDDGGTERESTTKQIRKCEQVVNLGKERTQKFFVPFLQLF